MTWAIDLDAATARHACGLVVKFVPASDTPGAFDGEVVGDLPAALLANPSSIAGLMREAGEAYIAARRGRH